MFKDWFKSFIFVGCVIVAVTHYEGNRLLSLFDALIASFVLAMIVREIKEPKS